MWWFFSKCKIWKIPKIPKKTENLKKNRLVDFFLFEDWATFSYLRSSYLNKKKCHLTTCQKFVTILLIWKNVKELVRPIWKGNVQRQDDIVSTCLFQYSLVVLINKGRDHRCVILNIFRMLNNPPVPIHQSQHFIIWFTIQWSAILLLAT